MKFMFSRYELKTITKRLVRGRNQSASEGKFMGSMAPYGYRAYKLPGEKGNSLMIVPEEAKVVQMIFDMYGKQGMCYNAIAYKLNDMHIPGRKGQWSQTSICNILTNEVYLGKIRWRREPVKRVVKEGMLSKKRILNDDYELYEGRHESIITEEQWDQVQEILNRHKHTSNHTERQLKNPFAGVLHCDKCGGIMKRYVPRPKESPTAWFRCMTRNCDCKMIKCEVAEKNILNAMLYCDAITDTMTKGLEQQKACVRYNILTSAMDVTFLYYLLPKYGMEGYFVSFLVTHLVNFILSLRRLLRIIGERLPAHIPLLALSAALAALWGAARLAAVSARCVVFLILLFCLFTLFQVCKKEDFIWFFRLIRVKCAKRSGEPT